MALTDQDIRLVRESWGKVQPAAEQAATIFYSRLFQQYPEVKPLFKSNMREQGIKLMSMLNFAVISLDRLEVLLPALEESGRRHAAYGVKDEDYGKVAEALVWTLGEALGDDFTPETRDAWISAYTTLADVMKEAARAPPAD